MIKPSMFTGFVFLLSALILVSASKGEILLEEDFEAGEIDEDVWIPAPSWKIIDGVLDATSEPEEVGYTVSDFTDFEFSADFRILTVNAGFLMRVPDLNNWYLPIMGVGEQHDRENTIEWNARVGGSYVDDARLPFESDFLEPTQPDEWYRIKFIFEGDKFTCFRTKRGEELDEKRHLVGTWENDALDSGAIGFREKNNEHSQYDNVLVTTIGYGVSPEGHLSTTWGNIKSGY